MSKLYADAAAALNAKRAADRAAALKALESKARAGVEFVKESALGQWFPDVEWLYFNSLTDGTVLVTEKGDDRAKPLILGVKDVSKSLDQGPSEWRVAVYVPLEGDPHHFEEPVYLKAAHDLGAYLERVSNKEEPAFPNHGNEDLRP